MNGQFIGTFGTGPALPPVRQFDPAHPERGGFDGVGLTYRQPYLLIGAKPTTTLGGHAYSFR